MKLSYLIERLQKLRKSGDRILSIEAEFHAVKLLDLLNPSAAQSVVDVMRGVEPGADRGALVPFREMRRFVDLGKADFDVAVLSAARRGLISLHRHDHASALNDAERDELVAAGQNEFYIGAAIRRQL